MNAPQLSFQHQQNLNHALRVLDTGEWDPRDPVAPGGSERALEVAFAAKHLRGVSSVLDVGLTFASPDYLGLLLTLCTQDVAITGVDIIPPVQVQNRYPAAWRESVLDIPVTIGDFRDISCPANAYDAVTLISTLEHIGFDQPGNANGGAFNRVSERGDLITERAENTDGVVFKQVCNALKPNGVLLLTVPMGRGGPVAVQDSLGLYACQFEYNAYSWNALRQHPDFSMVDEQFFKETPQGWVQVAGSEDLHDVTSDGRKHAAGCALLCLRKI